MNNYLGKQIDQVSTGQPGRRHILIAALAAGLTALGGFTYGCGMPPTPTPTCVPSPSPSPISPGVLVTSGVLTWGADPGDNTIPYGNGAPYVFRDLNGALVGFEVEIAGALAGLMSIIQELQPDSYGSLDNDLQSRNIDIILNGWEITPDHEKDNSFSDSYYRYSQRLVVRANDSRFSQYTASSQITLAELKAYTFGTGKGYKAAKLLVDASIMPVTSDNPLKALEDGLVDIVMIDEPIVIYFVEGIGSYAIASQTLRIIGQPIFTDSTSSYVMGFKKGDPNADKLRIAIDQALSVLKRDGTLKGIYQKWGLWNELQQDIGIVDCV